MKASDFAPNSNGDPCMEVVVSYDGITEHFSIKYVGGVWSSNWMHAPGDNTVTIAGVINPDYNISFDLGNNSFYFQVPPYAPIQDDQGNTIHCIAPGC